MTLLRVRVDSSALFAAHPPRQSHPNKQRVYQRAVPAGAIHAGAVELTRWAPMELPEGAPTHGTALEVVRDRFRYAAPPAGQVDWHLNFADPHVFFGYGGALFAQDEIQVAEHPVLAALRELLEAEHPGHTMTMDGKDPTPILVRGAERRVAIDTTAIYGNRFARASAETIDAAVQVLKPPTVSNILAIAAPAGGRGPYRSLEIEQILRTAYSGFAAAKRESGGARVVVHTGFWGCGVFGGNRVLTPLLQLLAARWAQIDALVFYAIDAAGEQNFEEARRRLPELERLAAPALIAQATALRYVWGTGDGN
ncbi:MAG: hypothetical protein U1E65_12870 [Myxococcota bacterium]